MSLLDVLTSPWAIVPEKLLEIQAVYSTHLRGEKIDISALEARLGRPLASEQQAYRIESNGVAVLPIQGVIAAKANLFTQISGGASADMLATQVQSMIDDPRVRAAVLDIDSPGGSVLGVPALAAAVRALSDAKPTVAVSTGLMASAAYWVGSAAGRVMLSGATDMLGSIGVVATHDYRPGPPGAQRTEITAGRYKRMASESKPLDSEGREYMQARVDDLYAVFVDAVAASRGVTAAQVLEHMADGQIFIGQQAIDRGLADGFATVDQMVARLGSEPAAFAKRQPARIGGARGVQIHKTTPAPRQPAGASAAGSDPQPQAGAPAAAPTTDEPVLPVIETLTPSGAVDMTTPIEAAAQFAAEHPEAAAALRGEGAEGERLRIKAVREQASMPGHEKLVEQLAMDGKTTGPEAAAAVLAAERSKLAAAGDARRNDAQKPVGQEPVPEVEAKPSKLGKDGVMTADVDAHALDAAVKAHRAKNPGTDYVTALKAVQQGA